MLSVAFQGEPGAYSEAAALAHFGPDIRTRPCESFDLVFSLVESGECERGLVPIENSLAGSIHRNYDLLMRHTLHITGEEFLRVRHCLIGMPGVKINQIKKVISHPQALAQCEGFLKRRGFASQTAYDTAGSVKLVKEGGDPSIAGIASRHAAQVYGMQILEEGIEDDTANFTRFLAISRQPQQPEGEAKTSIVFTLSNQPGALFKALSVFALRDLDLTKIESRPQIGRPWEYLFYIDFLGAISDLPCNNALKNLEEFAPMLRVLGSYARSKPIE
jgi:prephenate dehydratase